MSNTWVWCPLLRDQFYESRVPWCKNWCSGSHCSQNTHCKQTTKFRSLSHDVCRFLATLESYAHPLYKQKILEASSGDTEYTNLYGRARWPGAPHRTLRTPFFETWKNKLAANGNELNQPIIGQTTVFERVSKTPNTSIDCCQYWHVSLGLNW
jgi:hypothetical protein